MPYNITLIEIIFTISTILSGFFIVYSHFIFPLILKRLKINKTQTIEKNTFLPKVTFFIPAYNEEKYIYDKIINLSFLDYPSEKLNVIIYCDGCTDKTVTFAEKAIQSELCKNLNIQLINEKKNIGKINAINKIIPNVKSDIIALSDVSALLSIDALKISAQKFKDNKVGFVAATYDFMQHGSKGEKTYWSYQRNIKHGESALGAPIGCHGALYFIRAKLFQTLEPHTINDDFIIPMNIVAQGYKGVYDSDIMALELEKSTNNQDFQRRIRIAKGNLQQVFLLSHLLHPKYKGVSLSFFSGKFLRAFMPIFLIICFLGCAYLSQSQNKMIQFIFTFGFFSQCILYSLVIFKNFLPKNKVIENLHYLVSGHMASLLGIRDYVFQKNYSWKKIQTHS